jgi:bifunctional non-homologous end joining protein LigD
MSLKDYRAKRDFTKSPEPQGSDETSRARTGTKERFFCVQKHLATALHYDFRLEHNGVLLSWAVPKGPALDPAAKRLAMQVEDHPLEYGTFEGVIPEGYGAGVVMLWDRGTWEPEQDDVDAALAKGDLKFRLNGYKLKGSWVLVRTKGWGGGSRGSSRESGGESGGRSWLLIKHRDEWAGPIDITTFAPKSVKSDGTFKDILMQGTPDLWQSHKPAAGKSGDAALTKIVEKVLALEEEESSQQARDSEALEKIAAKEGKDADAASAPASSPAPKKRPATRKSAPAKKASPARGRAKRTAS